MIDEIRKHLLDLELALRSYEEQLDRVTKQRDDAVLALNFLWDWCGGNEDETFNGPADLKATGKVLEQANLQTLMPKKGI